MAKLLRISSLAMCLLVICSTAQAATYYVRTGGNDASTGKSPTFAFKTIQAAVNVAVVGDEVYVGGGTYADDVEIMNLAVGPTQLRFVADVTGARTGDAGAVTITAPVVVYNSDNVALEGFSFSGSATRFLIWRDSYEGLIKDCKFTSGNEGLLIKEASLEIDNCEITGFANDGIQVDGLTKMFIHDTTISGCGQSGIEIRKVAKIVMDTCSVTDNAGDGIELSVTTATINDGVVTIEEYVPLIFARDKLELKKNAKVYGYTTGSAAKTGSLAIVYGEKKVELKDSDTLIQGNLYWGPGGEYKKEKGTVTGTAAQHTSSLSLAAVNPGSAATVNDNGGIPNTAKGKDPVDTKKEKFKLEKNDSLTLPAGTYYFEKFEVKGTLSLAGPTVIYATDEVKIDKGAINNPSLKASDLRFYITGDKFEAEECGDLQALVYGPNVKIKVKKCKLYGLLMGKEVKIEEDATVYLDTTLNGFAKANISGTLPTGTATPPTPPFTVTDFSGGVLDISGSTFTGNDNGVRMVTEQNFNSRFTDYSSNSTFGLELYGTCQINNLTINSNSVGGMSLNQTGMSDMTASKLTIANNTQYGVYAVSSDLAFDSTNKADWNITGSQIAVAAVTSDITFQDVTMSGGTTAAVQLTQGNMKASNATFTGSGYGLAIDDSNVWLMNCTFSGNSVGLYANQNDFLSVTNSTFTGNTLWGASVAPSGTSGETATFSACTFNANAGGLSLVGATDGDVLLRDATVIRDNTAAGLHFESCTLAVNDQAAGANWTTLRNLYGISSNKSTLALAKITVQDSTSYGVRCQDSTVSLSGCTVTGPYGIYADQANDALTIDTSVFSSGTTPGWGVIRYGGKLDVTNSTLDGYWLGVYLYSDSGTDQATLLNTTIANATGFGMYIYSGDAVVRNTILTGDGVGYGLVRIAGTTTHSHNLLYGFSTPYFGTSADATETQKSPQFVDAANGDFHLGVGSAAINAGMDVGSLVSTDMEGNARPSFNGYEIGAYEYMNPNGSFRVLDWTETR